MTGKLRSKLRADGHSLKPSINLGKKGLSKYVKNEIKEQLRAHELIKLKVLDKCPLSKKDCAEILSKEKLEIVQIIGKTILVYCQNDDESKKINFF